MTKIKIYNFDEIGSTNDFAESIAYKKEDSIITAAVQTNGHGSKGRSFVSERGGLYITALRFYEDFKASEVFKIMMNASVSVCRTMEKFSISPSIKWPNDVFVNGKKICGILINNSFSGGCITKSVVGIGVNIENNLPEELKEIAVNMKDSGAKGYSFERVREELIKNLSRDFSVEEYKSYIGFFGKKITLIEGENKRIVTAKDVDNTGRLIVEDENGNISSVSAAEVSLRF